MKKIFGVLAVLAALLLSANPSSAQGTNAPPSVLSNVAGTYNARNYANWRTKVFLPLGGSIASGTGVSIPVFDASMRLSDGRTIIPFEPGVRVTIGAGSSSVQETVAITSVSGCTLNAAPGTCTIVVTTANQHGNSEPITSGSLGLDEAIVDAASGGSGLANPSGVIGGEVDVDPSWTLAGGTTAIIQATTLAYPAVFLVDKRRFAQEVWTLQGGLTTLAAPATLTAVTALASATPVGAFGTGTYHMCIAYVDLMGQEGPCSADFSQAGLATGSFIFSPPVASAGAVGYTIYIGLTGGGVTNLDYKVPLVTQPTVVGAYPAANGVCTLTQLETTTPACAVANTTYGQSGATATVTAITVNTSPIQPAVTVVSTTSIYVPNAGGRTTYVYAPGSRIGTEGIPTAFLPFTISAADATTVPSVIGTVNLRPGFMNVVGRTIEVCGKATTTATAATIASIQFQWDSMGQNTAGKGVQIGNLGLTPATAFATTGVFTFCEDFQTTVSSASATGGSINTIGGYLNTSGVATAAAGQGASSDPTIGAVGSLNLADDARLNVIYVHTTGTDGAALTLQSLSFKVLN